MRQLFVSLAFLALAACGGATSSASCCVNGSYFSCPDANAASTCSSACSRDSSKDNTCS